MHCQLHCVVPINCLPSNRIEGILPLIFQNMIELERLAQEGKATVMISCNIHSTEVASSQMSMELAYQLATENTPEVEEILENTILLLIPSANPDGLNMVVDWYERTVNTPYEGAPMPWALPQIHRTR